jgi:hypothetical protein
MADPFSFDAFWNWVVRHPNCILRAGTSDAVLYDDDDVHWHFAAEDEHTLVVQLFRGKRLAGELFVEPERIAFVQTVPGEEEVTFDLIATGEGEPVAACFFVLSHGFDEEEPKDRPRLH